MRPSTSTQSRHADIFRTDGGKSKSNAIDIPSLSLPKGGGAVKGIDEKFSVNAINGTSSFSIPLPVSPARGLTPSLQLSYNSGNGNGIFGLGWDHSLSSIKRKTDKGLPRYLDDIDSDVFLFSEAEDLVPAFKKDASGNFVKDSAGDYVVDEKDSADSLYTIRFYKPRVEGLYARIERWTKKDRTEIRWRVMTPDNITTLFGWTAQSRVADPQDVSRIYQWLPEFVFDDKGNCTRYIYKPEDASGTDPSLTHLKNRVSGTSIRYANLYPEKILYGNRTSYGAFGDVFNAESDFLFSVTFDYGEYASDSPFDKTNLWGYRDDAFSEYRSGFEIRTTRLCRRVLLFHHFRSEGEYDGLVRSLDFNYFTNGNEGFAFLKSVTERGYIRKPDGSYSVRALPPYSFDYQPIEWGSEVQTIEDDDLLNTPEGIDGLRYQCIDLHNEGLPGILTEQGNSWFYKSNLGNAVFERAKQLPAKPVLEGLGEKLQLVDLDADGGKQLILLEDGTPGFFELEDNETWERFKAFQHLPNIDHKATNTRLVDLNGDGRPDLLMTEDNIFTWHESLGRKGFSAALRVAGTFDEEHGPAMVLSDAMQTIFLADMSGDGMADIVRIRNGEVCYWPNLGYGKFGTKILMDGSPIFDHGSDFNPAYLRLADLDGSGTSDIIYLGQKKFSCWRNLSGNAFSLIPFQIETFPDIHHQSQVSILDILGNGLPCITWSSSLPSDQRSPLKYIDLMNSRKPHLMTAFRNNMGKEVFLEYRPSTYYYIQDKLAGRPWVTKLHFPIHCISRTETRDSITGHRFATTYAYHHGYFDHDEREFRGFGMVEQTGSEHFEHWVRSTAANIVEEELHQDPVLKKTWTHTGAFLSREKILNQFAKEYWHEEVKRHGFDVSHHEVDLSEARISAVAGLDPTLIDQLTFEDLREAVRACKGMMIRSEVFALDAATNGDTPEARQKELTPFSVVMNNCRIELVQPRGKNNHAVFQVRQSEGVVYMYERNPADPRIAHSLNVKMDELGNILESAAIVYPRKVIDSSLPPQAQQEQSKTTIIYSQSEFTNDVIQDDVYRLRSSSRVRTFELNAVPRSGQLYSIPDFDEVLSAAGEVPYYQDGGVSPTLRKRMLEEVRTLYYRNDLASVLPLHRLDSLAIPYESYQLAYTPELVYDLFGSRVNNTILAEGKYVHLDGDSNWWVRSGITHFMEEGETAANAKARFFSPLAYTDPYGARTEVKYYGDYFLFLSETTDAVGNRMRATSFNFRTLSPRTVVDINGNISEAVSDELGLVKAVALRGKGNEADDLDGIHEHTDAAELALVTEFLYAPDSQQLQLKGRELLAHATMRFVYDMEAHSHNGRPAVLGSISREEHFQVNANSSIQVAFEYSTGLGQSAMKKVQAEPGLAKHVVVNADGTYSVLTIDTSLLSPAQLRWVGDGRTVVNNKGNAVKQYEPYFSATHLYENAKELVETGVTPVMKYDAMDRLMRTDLPDGTYTSVVFDSWKHTSFDPADNCLLSRWYHDRSNRLIDALLIADGKDPIREKAAADKTALHDNTPGVTHLDNLGRAVLSIDHNKNLTTGADEFIQTRAVIDVEGNLRAVVDPRGNTVMRYKYDMLGNVASHVSMDSGQRWMFRDIFGNPLRTWDERNHEFQYGYDALQRPLFSKVTGGDGTAPLDHVYDRTFYGESLLNANRANEAAIQALNVLGRAVRQYDTAGLISTPEYNFKGQATSTTRRLLRNYREVANWTDGNLLSELESDEYTFITKRDALGRITEQTAPDGSVITPWYNEAGLLTREAVLHPGRDAEELYILDINYNEKGQRQRIVYGNNVITKFYYDHETLRLNRLETKRQNNDPLQDLHYTYDATGNITHIEDRNIPVTFFNNQKITGVSEYTYDALNRLVEAKGRENSQAQLFDQRDNWDNAPFLRQLNSGDAIAARNYTQRYRYDAVGNLLQMAHVASGNNWTRNFQYETVNNRLRSTQVGSSTYEYHHHGLHGFMSSMPHLESIDWNFKEEVVRTIRQRRTDGGTPETTYYQYDGQGQRVRKITLNSADAGVDPSPKDERIYISGYELYKSHSGTNAGLERVSLSLLDKGYRYVMVDMETEPRTFLGIPMGRTSPRHTVRYQAYNHQGSSTLELDENASVISYEEYHPYGTTAFQARSASISAAAKRYRYTGMERDEENGLAYHTARYYIPWLGRWLSSDTSYLDGGINLYAYGFCNPVRFKDSNGHQAENSIDDLLAFLHAQAGFETGAVRPPTFNPRSASPFGTAAHARATSVLQEMQAMGFAGAERIYSEVRVINGVITQMGGTPGGPKGSHNIDIMVARPGQTLTVGQSISGGVAESIGDLKYGGGTISPKYGVHGSPLQTITGRTTPTPTAPTPPSTPSAPAPPAAPAAPTAPATPAPAAPAPHAAPPTPPPAAPPTTPAATPHAPASALPEPVPAPAPPPAAAAPHAPAPPPAATSAATTGRVGRTVARARAALSSAGRTLEAAAPGAARVLRVTARGGSRVLGAVGRVAAPIAIAESSYRLVTATNTLDRIQAGADTAAGAVAFAGPVGTAFSVGYGGGQLLDYGVEVATGESLSSRGARGLEAADRAISSVLPEDNTLPEYKRENRIAWWLIDTFDL